MRFRSDFWKAAVVAFALLLASTVIVSARSAQDYSFKIHNNTKHRIVKVLVS